jgi:hypothetical protein
MNSVLNINPTKRVTEKDFYVKCILPYEDNHLQTHKINYWNPALKPGWFTDFEHMGFTYVNTILMETHELEMARTHGLLQFFRKGRNPEYSTIQKSILTEGKDIREKPTFLLLDDEETPEIIFDGNTVDNILQVNNSPNQMVALFKKNNNYTDANLIAVGGRLNSLAKKSGVNGVEDLEFLIRQVVKVDPTLQLKDGEKDLTVISAWHDKVKNYLKFMAGNLNLETKEFDLIINEIITEQTGVEQSISTTIPIVLEDMEKKGFVSNNLVVYTALAATVHKLISHWESKHEKNQKVMTAIHPGPADMSDPIKTWYAEAKSFWTRWNKHLQFIADASGISKDSLLKNYSVLGYYQNVSALNDTFAYRTVIPFEEIIEYCEKNNI